MHIACVKWGDKYSPKTVNTLSRMCAKHSALPFVCYTDNPNVDCETRPLPEGLTGWWNKLYLFSVGDILFFDLDVVILKDVSEYVGGSFGMAKDAWNPGGNSSVMWIPEGMNYVWDDFTPDVCSRLHGDQDWINEVTQPRFFDGVFSYKAHCRDDLPNGARVVFFHGKPNPWEVSDEWVKESYGAV